MSFHLRLLHVEFAKRIASGSGDPDDPVHMCAKNEYSNLQCNMQIPINLCHVFM